MSLTLTEVVAGANVVLFDFDGPLCHVFAGLPAATVASELAEMIGGDVDTDDPLDVLRLSTRLGIDVVRRVEDALIAAEVAAVNKSTATPGGVESIRTCAARELPVGIVSNNSASAVSVFLDSRGILDNVSPIVGRSYLHPELMKPNVWPIKGALRDLGCRPSDAIFVGDSLSDIQVAQAMGVPCVAYANMPGKRAAFGAASVVVDSMWEVNEALRSRVGRQPS